MRARAKDVFGRGGRRAALIQTTGGKWPGRFGAVGGVRIWMCLLSDEEITLGQEFFNTIFSPPLLILVPFKQSISADLRQSKRRRGTPARRTARAGDSFASSATTSRPSRLKNLCLTAKGAKNSRRPRGLVQSLKSQRSETMRQARVWVVALAAAALLALAGACANNTTQTGSAGYQRKTKKAGEPVLIGGAPTDNNAMLLRKGQMNVLQPAKDRGDIQIVSDQFAKDWRADEALRLTEDAITRTNGNIQAVVASNDGTAGGAISALEARGLARKVLVTGQDAQLDAVQRIAAGTQTMTVYKPIKPLADSAVDSAVKLAHGEALNAPDKINNGKIDVPSILQVPIAVDKDNLVDTVIKDGYHKLEDVYKDVPRDQWPKVTTENKQSAVGTQHTALASALAAVSFLFVGLVVA